MPDNVVWNELPAEEDVGVILPRRPVRDTADLDITPMIDITFLLLIFFLVASIPDAQTSVELPPAHYGGSVNRRTSVIITVAERGGPGPPLVYLADGKLGTPLPDDPVLQAAEIAQAVEEGFVTGKPAVLVAAERGVKHREVARVAAAASQVEGIKLHLAVLEVE